MVVKIDKETENSIKEAMGSLMDNPDDTQAYDFLADELSEICDKPGVVNEALEMLKTGHNFMVLGLLAGVPLESFREEL